MLTFLNTSIDTLISIGMTVLIVAVTAGLFYLLMYIYPKLYDRINRWEGTIVRPLRVGKFEVVSAATATALTVLAVRLTRWALSLGILYAAMDLILDQYPGTRSWNIRPAAIGIALTILTTLFAMAILRLIRLGAQTLTERVRSWKGTLITGFRIRQAEVISADRIIELLELSVRIARFLAYLAVGYGYITLVFSYFVFTRTWSATLFHFIMSPVIGAITSFVAYLPSLFTILVVAFIARYAIKLVHWIFGEIGKGTISLPGFYSEWAEPTYKIARFLIIVFAIIVIFPYLPGSNSKVFQGISIFVGVVFSLGSTSAVANIVAGVIMTYMRPFKVGDRVKIADTIGDVVEKTLLITRVRTIKNVDVTIPNAMVLGSHIINFSSSAQERGLILHTGVTIGYDAPWRKVHELLMAAASETPHILNDPPPFVLQTALNDFFVSYEINAFTDEPNTMATTYSELHQKIQDKFNEAGVEITSPHYTSVRDGNRTAIPSDYLPKGYSAPGFRISPFGKFPDQDKPKSSD